MPAFGKKDTTLADAIAVATSAGAKVIGENPANFTYTIIDPTGTDRGPSGTGDITVTITELGDGRYGTSFIPDALGHWVLTVTHPVYQPGGWSENYWIFNNLFDDVGSGNNLVTITVNDDISGNPIPDVTVEIYNTALTAKLAYEFTDGNGQIVFLLDDGSYKVVMSKLGSYTFTVPEDLTVSGTTAQTYTGTAFNPSAPASADVCIVYGWNRNQQDSAEAVTVESKLIGDRNTLTTDPHITTEDVSTTSQVSDGYWELSVIRSARYTSGDGKYQFLIDGVAGPAVTVPDATNAKLIDLEAAAT